MTAAATAAPTDEDDKLEPTNQNLERLQNDLFEQYDASIAPNDLNSFTIELTQSNFFPTKSLMTSHGRFRAVRCISINLNFFFHSIKAIILKAK